MTPLRLSLISGLLAAALTGGVLVHQRHARRQEADGLRTANNRLRFEVSQRREAQLASAATSAMPPPRGPAPASGESGRAASSQPLETLAAPAAGSAAPPHRAAESRTDDRAAVASGDHRNAGEATPVAAFQTLAWVCDRGDAAAMERLIYFDAAARPLVAGYLATLPTEARAKWATPEALAATLLVNDGIQRPYPPAMILAQARVEELAAGRVVLHLAGASRERTEFQQTPEGWRLAITAPMVEAYLRRVAGQKPAAAPAP